MEVLSDTVGLEAERGPLIQRPRYCERFYETRSSHFANWCRKRALGRKHYGSPETINAIEYRLLLYDCRCIAIQGWWSKTME